MGPRRQFERWDVQVGRFEAWELYHLGMGMDLNTFERKGADDLGNTGDAVQLYDVNFGDRRPSTLGYTALHLYPQTFSPRSISCASRSSAKWATRRTERSGTRPSLVLDFGILKLKGGGQYRKSTGGQTRVVGIESFPASRAKRSAVSADSAQVVLAPYAEFGVNYAKGLVDVIDDQGGLNGRRAATTSPAWAASPTCA